MMVEKLTEALNQTGMMVLENIDSDEQSMATIRKSLENSFSCYKERPREKKKHLSVQTSFNP